MGERTILNNLSKNRKLTSILALLLALMLAIVVSGCMKVGSPELDRLSITITPVDLFEGDKAKFESFLGMSGGFKLHYNGNKPDVRLAISEWENGKKTETYSILSDVFFVPEGEAETQEVEVIVSIDHINISEQDNFALVKYAVWDESGSSMVSFKTPWKDTLARRVIQYQEPITFSVDGDSSVPVWGIEGIPSGKPVRHHDLSEEALRDMEWALIVSLEFDDEKLPEQ